MNLLTQAGILARGFARRLFARWQRPEDTIAYVLEQLQQALNRHKLHLAELIVEHRQGERQLVALRLRDPVDQALVGRLAEQVADQWRRIEQGRLTLVALTSQIAHLKAKQGDVRLRAELLEAQGALRRLVGGLGATSVTGLVDQIEADLGRREQVQQVLDQLDALSAAPRPSQETGLEPLG
ncbi:hypothetical protein J7643_13670 [bacterium]|nr:hypothetical protein [bacterium]